MTSHNSLDGATGEYRVVRTVYVGDDDASGLIYFASYFRYMAEGDQDMFEALGQPVVSHIRAGVACPAVSSTCEFVSPARAGDTVVQRIRLHCGPRSSFYSDHEFSVEGKEVAAGRVTRVWVDLSTMTSEPVPDWIRKAGYRDPAEGQT